MRVPPSIETHMTHHRTRCARALVAAALAAAIAAACSSPPIRIASTARTATITTKLSTRGFPLGPNDVVRVGVYGHDELSTAGTRIDDAGGLSLPLVGSVHVAGLSTEEARAALTEALAKFVNYPRVDLSVVNYNARRCYVFGEVARSGAIDFDRPMTLLQALSLTGGFSSKADRANVVVLRGTPDALEVEVVDLEQPGERGFIALAPDDLVFVRRTGAGRFSDEILPYLQGVSSSLSSAATVLLIENQLDGSPQ